MDIRRGLLPNFLDPSDSMPQAQHNTPACQGQLGACHKVRPGLAVKRVREVVAPPPPGIDAACPLLQPPTLLGSVGERGKGENVTSLRMESILPFFVTEKDHHLPCQRRTYASDGDPDPKTIPVAMSSSGAGCGVLMAKQAGVMSRLFIFTTKNACHLPRTM